MASSAIASPGREAVELQTRMWNTPVRNHLFLELYTSRVHARHAAQVPHNTLECGLWGGSIMDTATPYAYSSSSRTP